MNWSLPQRTAALSRAERDGVDLLVIGGGITGAGVLRDAASRGLRALLVEREDFACGTSGRSSKMVHGGMRYLAQGRLGLTRESCRERDNLADLNPNLVRRVPFLLPSYEGGKVRPWQVRAVLSLYAALANFRRSARFRMLRGEEVEHFSRDLRKQGLRVAGLYHDGQVDDARLVIESLKSARRLGAEAVNHAEVVEFRRGADARIETAYVRDRLAGRTVRVRFHVAINAAGPAIERVLGLDEPNAQHEMRPAKGVHIAIPRARIHAEGAVTFEAADGRQLFLCPFDDIAFIGTTDTFTDEIDEPTVNIDEVHYLLAAANEAFPRAGLTTNDIRSVWAGVRPLVASGEDDAPPSDVSREYQVSESGSGLISVAGGKLTTYRATGEQVVDRVLGRLPRERRRAAGPSRTATLPLREDDFDASALAAELCGRYALEERHGEALVRSWGAAASTLLEESAPEWRRPIGSSRYLYAEIPWSFRTECAANLCDLLERRLRLALFAEGQGLTEIASIAEVAARAQGWDAARASDEAAAYVAAVRRRYQIVASVPSSRHAA